MLKILNPVAIYPKVFIDEMIQCLGFALDISAEREKTAKQEEGRRKDESPKKWMSKGQQMSIIIDTGDGPQWLMTILSGFVYPCTLPQSMVHNSKLESDEASNMLGLAPNS